MATRTASAFHWQGQPSVFSTDKHFVPRHNPGWDNLSRGATTLDQRGRPVVDLAPKTTGSICIEPRGGSSKRQRLAKGRAI